MRKGAGPLFLGIGLTALGCWSFFAAVGGGRAFLGAWSATQPLLPTRSTAVQTPRLDLDRSAAIEGGAASGGSIATGATTLLAGIAVTIACAFARQNRRGTFGSRSSSRAPHTSCSYYYKYRKDGLPEVIFEKDLAVYVPPPDMDNPNYVMDLAQVIKGEEDTGPAMTKTETAIWAAKRIEEIAEYNPMSEEEFQEEIEELTWNWKKKWIPILGWPTNAPHRNHLGNYKAKIIKRMPELFKAFRHFKPLILKYPSLLLRMERRTERPEEDKRREFNPSGFERLERLAGFNYADWAKEVYGKKEPGQAWTKFSVDDIVPGTVVGLDKRGAYIEIGSKAWAWCPNEEVSLSPIGEPSEVLSVGDEVTVQILFLDGLSKIRGDRLVQQIVVSMTRISRLTAWEDVVDARDGRASQDFEVEVVSMQTWGAVVRTKAGLEGLIPLAQLGDLAGEGTLVGTKITVLLKEAKVEGMWTKAERPGDYPIVFSYTDVVARKLGEELEEGQVVDAEVLRTEAAYLAVKLMAVTINIRKIDISSEMNFDIPSLFEVGETVKCFVLGIDEKTIRLSIRALEFQRGVLLTKKEEVFARAEETAKKYFKAAKAEKDKLTASLAATLAPDEKEQKPTRATSSIVDDEDDVDF